MSPKPSRLKWVISHFKKLQPSPCLLSTPATAINMTSSSHWCLPLLSGFLCAFTYGLGQQKWVSWEGLSKKASIGPTEPSFPFRWHHGRLSLGPCEFPRVWGANFTGTASEKHPHDWLSAAAAGPAFRLWWQQSRAWSFFHHQGLNLQLWFWKPRTTLSR